MELKLNVIEAKELRAADIGLSSDPYCEISIVDKEQKFKTKVIEKNLNPVWNEEFIIPIDNQETDALSIQVLDEDAGKDDVLGFVKIRLDSFKQDYEITDWFELDSTGPLSVIKAGQIRLSLTIQTKKSETEEKVDETPAETGNTPAEEEKKPEEEQQEAEKQPEEAQPNPEQNQEEKAAEEPAENKEQNTTTEEAPKEEEKTEEKPEDEKAESKPEEEEESAENQTDDQKIVKLKERIDLYHQKYLAIKNGKPGLVIPPRAVLKIIQSPTIQRKQAELQKQAEEEEEIQEEGLPNEEEEEVQQNEEEENQQNEEEEQEEQQGKEELENVIKQVSKRAQKIYGKLLEKYQGLTDNSETLKQQKKQREADKDESDLTKLSVDKLKEIYNKLVKENRDLDKQLAQQQQQQPQQQQTE